MNPVYFPILSLGIRALLAHRLQKAIQSQKKNQLVFQPHSPVESSLCLPLAQLLPSEYSKSSISLKIPLNRVKDKTQICYVSAIALKLAGQSSRKSSPVNIALEIEHYLKQRVELKNEVSHSLDNHLLSRVWQNVTVQVDSPGWIYLTLAEQGVAEWLHILVAQPMYPGNLDQSISRDVKNTSSSLGETWKIRDSTDKFYVLYSHARCCSLLRSATKDGMITQNLLNFELKDSCSSLFKPQHPAELHLIDQIAVVLDSISGLDHAAQPEKVALPTALPTLIWKSAQALSHSFEEFYKSCRIGGEVMQRDPQLAQMRLGLVLITQKVLRSLLESLAIEAPFEL